MLPTAALAIFVATAQSAAPGIHSVHKLLGAFVAQAPPPLVGSLKVPSNKLTMDPLAPAATYGSERVDVYVQSPLPYWRLECVATQLRPVNDQSLRVGSYREIVPRPVIPNPVSFLQGPADARTHTFLAEGGTMPVMTRIGGFYLRTTLNDRFTSPGVYTTTLEIRASFSPGTLPTYLVDRLPLTLQVDPFMRIVKVADQVSVDAEQPGTVRSSGPTTVTVSTNLGNVQMTATLSPLVGPSTFPTKNTALALGTSAAEAGQRLVAAKLGTNQAVTLLPRGISHWHVAVKARTEPIHPAGTYNGQIQISLAGGL